MLRFIAALAVLSATYGSAGARTFWYQLPSQPLWVEVPDAWKGRADAKNPVLLFNDRGGARFDVRSRPLSISEAQALADRKEALRLEFPKARWTRAARPVHGRLVVGNSRKVLLVAVFSASTHRLVLTALGPEARKDELIALLGGVGASGRAGWARPTGQWHALPETELRIRQPPDGWQRLPKARRGTLALRHRAGSFQAELRRSRSADCAPVLDWFIQGLGGPGVLDMRVGKAVAWRPKGLVGGQGRAAGLMQEVRLTRQESGAQSTVLAILFAHPTTGGVVLMAAMLRVDADAAIRDARTAAESLSPVP